MTQRDEFTLVGHAGMLAAVRWVPDGLARYVVLLCHGYGEHMGRYQHAAERLANDGAVVLGLDHAGHGRSDGERVIIEDLERLVEDLHQLQDIAHQDYPELPVVLIGHSMGGTIAARYAQRFTGLACLVLSAPALGRWEPLEAMLAMDEIPDVPLDPSALSRDPSVGADYAADPLVWHGAFRRTTLEALQAAMVGIGAERLPPGLPVLWLHGSEDQIVAREGTEAGWAAIAPAQAATLVYQGARHECFNEVNRQEVLDDVVTFIRSHLPIAGDLVAPTE